MHEALHGTPNRFISKRTGTHNTHCWYTHIYLQPLGALKHDLLYWNFHATYNTSAAQYEPQMSSIYYKLNWFMTYFGHANICLAGKEKYVAKNIAKPRRLLHRSRISTFITANPRTDSKGIQKLRAVHTGDKRVCLTLILKLSHFQKQIMSVLSNLHP